MFDPKDFAATQTEVERLSERQHRSQAEVLGKKEKVAKSHPIPRHKPGQKFVCGPIPCGWLQKALTQGGKAGALCWAIWWLAGIQRSNPIRLTAQALRRFSIQPQAARRLLSKFEKVGLVKVNRKTGRGPMVTLLHPSSAD